MELYDAILDHLHLIDLGRLRRVCKRLRCIVQAYRIQELALVFADLAVDTFTNADPGVYQNSSIHRPKNLNRTMPYRIQISSSKNSLFDPFHFYSLSLDSTVKLSVFDLFLRSSQFNVQCLKSLAFTHSQMSRYLDLEFVNQFEQLERLEMGFYKIWHQFTLKLSLLNLKTLLLNLGEDSVDFTLRFEAPQCQAFHLRNGFLLESDSLRVSFGNPHSVKQLSLHDYHRSSHIFKSIEFLQLVSGAHLIDEQTFDAFPSLNTLKIIQHNSLEGLRQLFERCKHRNVKLVFHGIHLVNGHELNAFQESDFEHERLSYAPNYGNLYGLLANYEKLEEGLNFLEELEFSDRAARLLKADADRFVRIFNNLNQISSQIKIERPDLFLRLLTSSGRLQHLSIRNSGMAQQSFDQLANIRMLDKLHIEEKTKVDLSFTARMPILQSVTINHDVDLREEIRLHERAGLYIYVKKYQIDVDLLKFRWGPSRYVLVVNRKGARHDAWMNREPQQSFEDLVRRYEQVRKEVIANVDYPHETESKRQRVSECGCMRKAEVSRELP